MSSTILQHNVTAKEEEKTLPATENGIWKTVIEGMVDPASGMSEDEIKAYDTRIRDKLKRGKKLTTKEMNFLKIHNPNLYRTALRVKFRKEQLEQQLKHCRSKSEAAEVARRAISSIDSKDPDKEYLAAGLSETIRQFRKSSAYARLPETEEHGRKKRSRRVLNFEEEEESEQGGFITPIQEVLDELPTFDVVQ